MKSTEDILAMADRLQRISPDPALYQRIWMAAGGLKVRRRTLWLAAASLALLAGLNVAALWYKSSVKKSADMSQLANEYFGYMATE